MSEHRKPSFSLLLQIPGKAGVKIEFFDAALFGEATDEPTVGRYRLRVGGRWFCPKSTAKREYFFTDLETTWKIVRREFGLGPKVPPEVDPSRFPTGTKVRAEQVEYGYFDTVTLGVPFKDEAGSWRVFIGGVWAARNPEYLELLKEPCRRP